MTHLLRRYAIQVRRGWWIVLALTLVGVAAGAASSLPARTTYVGESTMVMSSPGRSPDQDRATVLGFVTLFNDPATQARLRREADVPAGVTLSSTAVAGSAILSISATADRADVAQEAATNVARAFRTDLQPPGSVDLDASLAKIQQSLDDVRSASPKSAQVLDDAAAISDGLDALRYALTNRLAELQARAGVRTVHPSYVPDLVLGGIGGLFAGVLLALLLAAVSSRVRDEDDLRDKADLPALVVLPRPDARKGGAQWERGVGTLVNVVTGRTTSPAVVALVGTGTTGVTDRLAQSLGHALADQDLRTVVVSADGELGTPGEPDAPLKGLSWPGAFANRRGLVTRKRTATALDDLRSRADVVVVAGPSLSTSTDPQLLGAAADLTVVVADTRDARADRVNAGVQELERSGATVLGVALVGASSPR